MTLTTAGARIPGVPVDSERLPMADIRETHTGVVVLVGDRAYKAKKPIVTDFCDFSSVELREEACAREILLNRRLAPSAYLGLAWISDPTGEAAEPLVVMRRYPDANRLASLAMRGDPLRDEVDALADVLSRFHACALRSEAIARCGSAVQVAQRWTDNLIELAHWAETIVTRDDLDEIDRLSAQYVDGRAGLFDDRALAGRVVDGHGDLLADDVFCMPEGPILLDCLEFDDALRYVDCVDDIAFLAMDLEFLGRGDLGRRLIERYRELTEDAAPQTLWHFYIAYRALVRAKVDCIRADQGKSTAIEDARRHVRMARDHLEAGTVKVVVVGGGPGTGKTTLARGLSERTGAQVISTDDVRDDLVRAGVLTGASGKINAGLYNPGRVDIVYREVLQRAGENLRQGRSVILDGTWRDDEQRRKARALADEHHCPIVELTCSAPLAEAQRRIESRQKTASAATPAIAAALADEDGFSAQGHHIDTTRPLGDSVDEAQALCCVAV